MNIGTVDLDGMQHCRSVSPTVFGHFFFTEESNGLLAAKASHRSSSAAWNRVSSRFGFLAVVVLLPDNAESGEEKDHEGATILAPRDDEAPSGRIRVLGPELKRDTDVSRMPRGTGGCYRGFARGLCAAAACSTSARSVKTL